MIGCPGWSSKQGHQLGPLIHFAVGCCCDTGIIARLDAKNWELPAILIFENTEPRAADIFHLAACLDMRLVSDAGRVQ